MRETGETPPRLSRRVLLRSALANGSGLIAAYAVGCGDGEDGATAPTATGVATAPGPTATAAPGALRWRRIEALGSGSNSDEFPPPRRDHSLVSDGERLYLFGGRDTTPLSDLWEYRIADNQWNNKLRGNDGLPAARFGHNAAWAPGHTPEESRMLVFGGQAGGTFFNDVSAFDPAVGWSNPLAAIDPAALPAARYGAAAAVVFGGQLWVTHGFTSSSRFDDTWSFSYLTPTGWEEISPAGERPIERFRMRAVADSFGPHGARLLMFGGQTTDTPYLGDLWALEVDGWREITSEPRPSPRNFYAMVFDFAGGRALLFGGDTDDGPVNDLWAFDSAAETWSRLTPEGDPPSPRAGHDAALGPDGRVYIFGGATDNQNQNDLWELGPATA
jgi:hypothetical protein